MTTPAGDPESTSTKRRFYCRILAQDRIRMTCSARDWLDMNPEYRAMRFHLHLSRDDGERPELVKITDDDWIEERFLAKHDFTKTKLFVAYTCVWLHPNRFTKIVWQKRRTDRPGGPWCSGARCAVAHLNLTRRLSRACRCANWGAALLRNAFEPVHRSLARRTP